MRKFSNDQSSAGVLSDRKRSFDAFVNFILNNIKAVSVFGNILREKGINDLIATATCFGVDENH